MNQYLYDGKHIKIQHTGAAVAGNLIQIGGEVGIIDPKPDGSDWASGELGTVTCDGVVEIENSGVVFAYGAAVGYDATDNDAVAGAGGDFDAGICVNPGGAAATDKVAVWLNKSA